MMNGTCLYNLKSSLSLISKLPRYMQPPATKMHHAPFYPNHISSADFDPNFAWGAATSAYQIEGAASEGGRGPSIWDDFCKKYPEVIHGRHNGMNACNAYHKVKEDVKMMKDMGLTAYRFSISWSRILPHGKRHLDGVLDSGINWEGVKYYKHLLDELDDYKIEPYATLWHWDTPQALEEEYMGFLDKRIIDDFEDYAKVCFEQFGGQVKHWITLNEPQYYSSAGYASIYAAPGRGGKPQHGNPSTEPYIVARNQLLAHAAVVHLYHKEFADQKGKIGITLNIQFFEPLNPESERDKHAALRSMDFIFGWYMEPLFSGRYPDTMTKNVKDRLPEFTKAESDMLKGAYDFVGVNYYCSQYATDLVEISTLPTSMPKQQFSYTTDNKVLQLTKGLDGKHIGRKAGVFWFYSYPPGFYKVLMHIKNTYGDPLIYVTENGWADNDQKPKEEACLDIERIEYHQLHLQNLKNAISDGARVKGYFVWSLMDNFEWSAGYSVRFGLVFVDLNDKDYKRYLKMSAVWFKTFLESGKELEDEIDDSEIPTTQEAKKPKIVVEGSK